MSLFRWFLFFAIINVTTMAIPIHRSFKFLITSLGPSKFLHSSNAQYIIRTRGSLRVLKNNSFLCPMKNENNLPRPAEILKASEGFPSPLAKLCLISWGNNASIFFPGLVPSWVRSRAQLVILTDDKCGHESLDLSMTIGWPQRPHSVCEEGSESRPHPSHGEPQSPVSSQSPRGQKLWNLLY